MDTCVRQRSSHIEITFIWFILYPTLLPRYIYRSLLQMNNEDPNSEQDIEQSVVRRVYNNDIVMDHIFYWVQAESPDTIAKTLIRVDKAWFVRAAAMRYKHVRYDLLKSLARIGCGLVRLVSTWRREDDTHSHIVHTGSTELLYGSGAIHHAFQASPSLSDRARPLSLPRSIP